MFSEIYCVLKGRVQGVGYRDFVERYANEHSHYGWIKNKEDGSVIVLLQATPDELKACIEMLNIGSTLAQVDTFSVDWRTPVQLFEEFKVIAS